MLKHFSLGMGRVYEWLSMFINFKWNTQYVTIVAGWWSEEMEWKSKNLVLQVWNNDQCLRKEVENYKIWHSVYGGQHSPTFSDYPLVIRLSKCICLTVLSSFVTPLQKSSPCFDLSIFQISSLSGMMKIRARYLLMTFHNPQIPIITFCNPTYYSNTYTHT